MRHVAGMHPESRADSPAASPNVRQFLQGVIRRRSSSWSQPGLIEALASACQEYFAHRGSMVVRAGDAFPGVLVIAKGSLRVEALGDVVEGKGPERIPVGQLGEGDFFGAMGSLRKELSKFSFQVTSRYLRGFLLPSTAVSPKLVPLLNAVFVPEELEDDERFQMTFLEDLARRVALAEEDRLIPSDVGIRERYLIPPHLQMRCLPDLVEQATRRRSPPPPKVEKQLQEVQREKRQQLQRKQKERQHQSQDEETLDLALRPEASLSAAALREGSFKYSLPSLIELSEEAERLYRKGRPRRERQEQPWFGRKGAIFIPKSAADPNDWRCSKAFHFCRNMPVWQPGKLEDWEIVVPTDEQVADFDVIQELCGEEVNAESFEKGLRNRMSRIGSVLKQAQNAMSSGFRQLYGQKVSDAESLAKAMDGSGCGAVDAWQVVDALTRLRIAAPSDRFEELVNVVERDAAGKIPLETLKQAFIAPKQYVNSLESRYRERFAQVSELGRFSSASAYPRMRTNTAEASVRSSQPVTSDSDSGTDIAEDSEEDVMSQGPALEASKSVCRVPCAATTMQIPLPLQPIELNAGACKPFRPRSANGCHRSRQRTDTTSASLSAYQKGHASTLEGALRRPHTAPREGQGVDLVHLRQEWHQAQQKAPARPPWSARR